MIHNVADFKIGTDSSSGAGGDHQLRLHFVELICFQTSSLGSVPLPVGSFLVSCDRCESDLNTTTTSSRR